MTAFATPLESGDYDTLRASGYWARPLCCLCPEEVVFKARSTQTIEGQPFIQFTYDTVTVGAYTDVWPNMVAYISATGQARDAKYRGRVRLAPSSSVFYIDLNPTLLNEDDYIIVVRDTDLFVRLRNDTLVDSSVAYHDLPPMLAGLPHAIVLYDADADGQVTYTPDVTGIPVDVAATTVNTWAWAISGAGTSGIDNAALQAPTLTFQAGYHYLLRVIYTDDNFVSNYQIVHVYAVTRTFTAPVVQPVVAGSITGDESGWTASLTAYADVSTLLDRTHCAVFAVERFGDNSSAPLVSNVWMSGRLRSDSVQIEGSAEAGRLAQVSFTVEGFTAYLRRLRIPNDIVRAVSSPDEWGEMQQPNPYRMAVYAMWTYTTLTNLVSFAVEDGAFAAWRIGVEPRGIEGGFALDVLTSILAPIKAAPNFAPDGEIYLARAVSYQDDRTDVPLVAVFTLDDLREASLDRDSSRTTAQVIAYGGVYSSTNNTITLYTAEAPRIGYGDGGEVRELTREILAANSSATDAQDELAARASNEFAYQNPKPLLKFTPFDSWAGVLRPTNFQRWAAVIPSSANPRGIAYTATDYWQIQSVTLGLNADGTVDLSVEAPAETTLDDAQIDSYLLPNDLENTAPVLPVGPNDLLFPTDPLELYPSDTPGLEDLQPLDPFSGMTAYTPLPPDVAAQAALNQGNGTTKTLRVNFHGQSGVNTVSDWTTRLGVDYLLTISGEARVSRGFVRTHYDFTKSDYGIWRGDPTYWPRANDYRDGTGYHAYVGTTGYLGVSVTATLPETITTSLIQVNYDYSSADGFTDGNNNGIFAGADTLYLDNTVIPPPTPFIDTDPHTFSTFYMQILFHIGSVAIKSITFEGGSGPIKYRDGFYEYEKDDTGEPINVAAIPSDEGLFIDNSRYSEIPQFDKSHRYAGLAFAGTNNPMQARMQAADYTQTDDRFLFIEARRKES